MTQPFDAYRDWLGIPAEESADGGPHHYRLLGLRVFESNPQTIDAATRRVAAHISAFQAGPQQPIAQRLLSEVWAAATCLLDPTQKAQYDRALATGQPLPRPSIPSPALLAAHPASAPPYQPPQHQPPPPQLAPAASVPNYPQPAAAPQLQYAPQPAYSRSAPPTMAVARLPISTISPSRLSPAAKRRPWFVPQTIMAVLGGITGLTLGYFLVYYLLGEDLLRLLPRRKPLLANKAPTEPTATRDPSPPASRQPRSPPRPLALSPPLAAAPRPSPSPPASPEDAESSSAPPFVAPPLNTAPLPGVSDGAAAPQKKLPQPTAEERQKMLTELQSLYKTEFERGNKPDGRAPFLAFLLETARKLKSEPAAQFVLYREAYDRAIKLDNFITAADAIDELEQTFDVDGFRSRLNLLTEALRAAKTPDERLPLVQFALDLADYAQATQRVDELPKLVSTAEAASRSAPKDLRAKVAARAQELKKVADDFGQITAARQRLAADPADGEASLIDGKYLCFSLGDWPAGLKLLAQSNHPALAFAARQDLAGPEGSIKPVALGDLWFDIGASEPVMSAAYARARHWYEQAAPFATGLEKVKLDKRLEQIAAMNLPPRLFTLTASANPQLPSARLMLTQQKAISRTDILNLLTPDSPHGAGWTISSHMARVDAKATWARLPSPVSPTGEYQMALRLNRSPALSNTTFGSFVAGLPSLRSPLLVVIDYPLPAGYASFLALSGHKRPEDNPTFKLTSGPVPRIQMNQLQVLICAVKSNQVLVKLDGETLIDYRGDMNRLTMPSEWAAGNSRTMFLGAHQGGFNIYEWSIAPLRTDAGAELPLETSPYRASPNRVP